MDVDHSQFLTQWLIFAPGTSYRLRLTCIRASISTAVLRTIKADTHYPFEQAVQTARSEWPVRTGSVYRPLVT